MNVEWSDGAEIRSAEILNAEEALELLKTLTASLPTPAMVEFFDATGRAIALGVGRQKTIVTYQDSIDPPYYISQGDADNDESVFFQYGGEETEYLGQNVVELQPALNAIRDFFRSSSIYSGLEWERL